MCTYDCVREGFFTGECVVSIDSAVFVVASGHACMDC